GRSRSPGAQGPRSRRWLSRRAGRPRRGRLTGAGPQRGCRRRGGCGARALLVQPAALPVPGAKAQADARTADPSPIESLPTLTRWRGQLQWIRQTRLLRHDRFTNFIRGRDELVLHDLPGTGVPPEQGVLIPERAQLLGALVELHGLSIQFVSNRLSAGASGGEPSVRPALADDPRVVRLLVRP